MANLTFSVLEDYNSSESLQAIVMDNTPLNTGFQGGLCACLEKKLERKLHLIGCFLHINELPLRHLIRNLDGKTKSGNKFSGDIGMQLDAEDLHMRDLVRFESIPTQCQRPDDKVLEDLSDDQRLLLEYALGVSLGTVDYKYAKRKPGPVNHSRWLTTATRIMYLYTRTVEPTETLKTLVTFIVQIYAPVWFMVKHVNNFTKGPMILFDIIGAMKEVEKKRKVNITEKLFEVLQRNAYCCLGENFLASLLFSSSAAHRKLAIDKILKIRSEPKPGLIPTRIPKVNFDAEDWSKLIDTSSLNCHEPPCVRNVSNTELEAMRDIAAPAPIFPLHSQSVERAVKLTSEASGQSYIWELRHKYIVSKNKCRALRPQFRSKNEYI